jgi:phosphoglycerate dehydrogenase-like enzyme
VFEEEPLPTNSPFWTKDRMIVTPHVAGFAPDYVESVGNLFTKNLRRYLDRQPLLNLADRTRGY